MKITNVIDNRIRMPRVFYLIFFTKYRRNLYVRTYVIIRKSRAAVRTLVLLSHIIIVIRRMIDIPSFFFFFFINTDLFCT